MRYAPASRQPGLRPPSVGDGHVARGPDAVPQREEQAPELSLHLGVGGRPGQVGQLVRILHEVVELALARDRELGVDPAAGPDPVELGLRRGVDPAGDPHRAVDIGFLQPVLQPCAIHGQPRAGTGQAEERRRQIGERHGRADLGTPREPRPGDVQRHLDGGLVDHTLVEGDAVFTVRVAVVAGEHEKRCVQLAGGFDGVDDLADALVDRSQRRQLPAVLLGDDLRAAGADLRELTEPLRLVRDIGFREARVSRHGCRREGAAVPERGPGRAAVPAPAAAVRPQLDVRGGVPDLEVERIRLGSRVLDELPADPRDDIRLVVARRGPERRLHAVVVERVVVHQERVLRGGPPLVPSDRAGPVRAVAVHVLADVRGAVAGVVQPAGQRVGLVHAVEPAPVLVVVGRHAVVVRVLARHQARPGGAAQRDGHDGVAEGGPPLRDELLHRRQGGHLIRRLVVGQEEHDVRPRPVGRPHLRG